jgi:WD40 repeat protein
MATECSDQYIITATQDRKLSFLEIESGKTLWSHSPTVDALDSSSSFISTLATDPSGLFIAAGVSDKSIRIIDLYNVNFF